MRKRAALLTTTLAIASMTALGAPAQATPAKAPPVSATVASAPAQAEAGWLFIDYYTTRNKCVDAGQQYQREGFSTWKCPYDILLGYFALYVK